MERKVSFGVIGACGIARRRTIPAMLRSRNCRVAAVMDVKGAEDVAREFGIPRHYEKEEDLVGDPEVEAVYIATPAHLHLEHIRLAARAKKHVLCEKPLALSSGQVREAIRASRKNGVFLQEGFMMKFHGAHRMIRRLISDGRLGKVVSLRAQLSCWYPPIRGAWRQDPRTGGGGALIDMATHLLDLLEFFAGRIEKIAAITGNLVHPYRSEDSSTILAQFESGAHGTIDCFFCIPDRASRTRLEIYGSKGAVLAEGTIGQGSGGKVEGIFDLGAAGYDAAQGKDAAPKFRRIGFPAVDPYAAECECFADCIAEGRPPEVNGARDALHLIDLVEKAYASWKKKRFLTV